MKTPRLSNLIYGGTWSGAHLHSDPKTTPGLGIDDDHHHHHLCIWGEGEGACQARKIETTNGVRISTEVYLLCTNNPGKDINLLHPISYRLYFDKKFRYSHATMTEENLLISHSKIS